ncbi:ABC transporter substrate-binding protein [Pseudomonas aeruginosa]|uniref:ABC transporter substrate-binding protein n=1 Tax=Pseudomonas aeruginosa TaxID=287 RepID=UPI00104F828A|nr:ABC transporter substrate-binding protein [Pseudomonas aeruginosa]
MCLDDPTHSRRDILKLAALLSAAGALPLLSSLQARAAAEPDAPVRIGYLPITDATPLLVAHANGLFEAEGIQAERPVLLRSWAQVIEAFISGQVNVIHLLSPMTVWARYGSKALAADEVNLVVLPPSDMPPALASKRIHGYIVAEPFNALAENLKVGRVQRFTGDVWRNHACCVVFMHEHDLERRPQWSQKVVNAIVKAQLWTREHRAEAAQLLSKAGANRYTPHAPEVLGRVLAPGAEEQQAYLASGAIRHADWQERRIDFQPYPYPSYTEELVRRLKDTLIEGNNAFLASLDPRQVASDLVDDRFVRQALAEVGGLQAFGLAEGFQRSEEISP